MPQPVTLIGVLRCRRAPFCPTIVVGIVSAPPHRPLLAESAECGPSGRSRTNFVIGTSGTALNADVMPLAPKVTSPLRSMFRPWPCISASSVGRPVLCATR